MAGARHLLLACAGFVLIPAAHGQPMASDPPSPEASADGPARPEASAGEAVAAAQDSLVGVYALSGMMETASALELRADGRFAWYLSVGALDMIGEGRWARSGDNQILLDTVPAYRPPQVALVGTRREPAAGIHVRIVDADGRTPEYLGVEAEYADGSREREHFTEGAHLFDSTAARRVVAIVIDSAAFGFASERYRVEPDGDNVFVFRFTANDLGRPDFRDQPVTVDGDMLTLDWRGTQFRYRRATPEELAGAGESGADLGMAESGGSGDAEARNWELCRNEGDAIPLARAIAGCTALIDSGSLNRDDLVTALFNRGGFRITAGDAAGAVGDFDRTIALNPQEGGLYAGRAMAFARLGDFRRALAESREAVRLAPEEPFVLGGLCRDLAALGEELDRARAACDTSLRIAPGNEATLASRGMVNLRQGRFEQAWNDYDAALRRGPEDAGLLFGRGIAALRLAREAEGRADLDRALALDPSIAATYAQVGIEP